MTSPQRSQANPGHPAFTNTASHLRTHGTFCFGARLRELSKHERAALFVKNGMHGRSPGLLTPRAFLAQRLYHHPGYRWAYITAAAGVMALALFEPPARGAAADTALAAVRGLDFLWLAAVAVDLWLQVTILGPTAWVSKGWIVLKCATLAATLLNLVLTVATGGAVPYVMRALRPLFIIERLRKVKQVRPFSLSFSSSSSCHTHTHTHTHNLVKKIAVFAL